MLHGDKNIAYLFKEVGNIRKILFVVNISKNICALFNT